MADGPKNVLVNIDGKAAEKLVDKSSDGIAGLFKPWHIKRVAKAEAEAALIRAESDIAVADLHRRATHRRLGEDAWHQQNIEQIEAKATLLLTDGSDASKVDHDWSANFFDKSKIVSDTEMQSVWARVLAGEIDAPGSFSRRTVNSLANLDRDDAETFTKLCGFACIVGGPIVMVYDHDHPIYESHGITFSDLTHLDDIGLIKFQSHGGARRGGAFRRAQLPARVGAVYYRTTMMLELKAGGDSLPIGDVLLTSVGAELLSIAGGQPVPGFLEFLMAEWARLGVTVVASPRMDEPT